MYISYINKRTNKIETRQTKFVTKKNKEELEKRMQCFYYLYDKALKILESGDVSKHYRTEYRLKKNNSKRRIDVPDEQLMKYQKEMVYVFTKKLEFIFPKSVYGYVKGRNAKQMAEVHKNQYQVIKLDIKDFFPNCTLEFIMNAMSIVYPFCLLNKKLIETIIMPCMVFYDGKYRLPQGAPTSPILSNIAMIPIDYALEYSWLNSREYSYKYTRFADDIIISHCKFYFSTDITAEERLLLEIFGEEEPKISLEERNYKIAKIVKEVINSIENCLQKQNPDFSLNSKKTKVLNTACGNVWMLGVSVGGNDVKIGNKKKQFLKATLWSFLNDCKNQNPWNKKETRHMLGILGYAKHVEPNFVNELITKYEQKTGVN